MHACILGEIVVQELFMGVREKGGEDRHRLQNLNIQNISKILQNLKLISYITPQKVFDHRIVLNVNGFHLNLSLIV